VIRQESWILGHFEIFVTIALKGAYGNRCKTEDGDATWRIALPEVPASYDCFLVLYLIVLDSHSVVFSRSVSALSFSMQQDWLFTHYNAYCQVLPVFVNKCVIL